MRARADLRPDAPYVDGVHANRCERAHFLRSRRKQLGLTRLDLAELAGVSVRFLGDLERGKSSVQLGMVMAVARTLGWRLTTVVPGGGE